jgi:hypothetical protein
MPCPEMGLKLQLASPIHEEALREVPHPLVALPDVRLDAIRRRTVDRLGGADRVGEVGKGQRPDEGVEPLGVLRRVLADQAEQGAHPDIALEPGQGTAARAAGCGSVDAGQVSVEAVGWEPVAAGHVADVDPHAVSSGLAEAQRL